MIFFNTWPVIILILLALASFASGLSRGFSGFGAALIFVPLASALLGPKVAAPILAVVDPIFACLLIPNALKVADRRSVGFMFLGAVVGIPLGTAVLQHSEPFILRWLISAIAAGMFLLLASGWRYRGQPRNVITSAVGVVSGLFSGIAQIGGPPVVCYWMGTDTNHAKLRANIILYFAASSLLAIATYYYIGLLSWDVLKLSLIAGPAYGLGIWGGSMIFPLASPAFFRNSSLALIAFAVVMSLPVLR